VVGPTHPCFGVVDGGLTLNKTSWIPECVCVCVCVCVCMWGGGATRVRWWVH
jgi:hypothetical protein